MSSSIWSAIRSSGRAWPLSSARRFSARTTGSLFGCSRIPTDGYEALLGTHHVERFLRFALREHFASLQPVVERMLASGHAAAAQAGARQVCLAAFDVPEAAVLAERALAGDAPLRVGAAQVYAANLMSDVDPDVCVAALRRLFDDPEAEVRAAAVNFLSDLPPEALPRLEPLLRALIQSAAFAEADDQLLRLMGGPRVTSRGCCLARILASSPCAAAKLRTSAPAPPRLPVRSGSCWCAHTLRARTKNSGVTPSTSSMS